jgi:uncharacterized protein YndB with AHSA1/START domain
MNYCAQKKNIMVHDENDLQNIPPTGLTKGAGWQVGARRTFEIKLQQAWDMLTSPEGVKIWLGDSPGIEFKKGARYKTLQGTSGVMRVVNPGNHLRLTWQSSGWSNASTLQVRLIPNGEKTVISFHQEKLLDASQRQSMRQHWLGVLDQIQALLET